MLLQNVSKSAAAVAAAAAKGTAVIKYFCHLISVKHNEIIVCAFNVNLVRCCRINFRFEEVVCICFSFMKQVWQIKDL